MSTPSSTQKPKTIIVGLSGPSSSGKTTLARLLRGVFNINSTTLSSPSNNGNKTGFRISLFIVHEDDFYKTDVDIPYRTWQSPSHGPRREQDWDCVESLDLPLLSRVLAHIKSTGYLPADFASKEDQNSVGDTGVDDKEISRVREDVQRWLDSMSFSGKTTATTTTTTTTTEEMTAETRELRICILEGFLLFPPPSDYLVLHSADFASTSPDQLTELDRLLGRTIDVKLFLPCSRDLTVSRRARRSGYVTLEGFWADPPGYVEELVWPNYVRDHGWLFDGSVNDADAGNVSEERASEARIAIGPGRGDQGMKVVFDWGVDIFKNAIEMILDKNGET